MFKNIAILLVLVAGCSRTPKSNPPQQFMMQASLPWQDAHGQCLRCDEAYTDDELVIVGYQPGTPMYLYYCFDMSSITDLDEYRQKSHRVFLDAMSGPGKLAPPRGRALFDIDDDGDVDLRDYADIF